MGKNLGGQVAPKFPVLVANTITLVAKMKHWFAFRRMTNNSEIGLGTSVFLPPQKNV